MQVQGISYDEIAIREEPPSDEEIGQMLKNYNGSIAKLFNSSGKDYRSGQYKDKLKTMSEADLVSELSNNGNLIKRPFLIREDGNGLVGFKEDQWKVFFGISE